MCNQTILIFVTILILIDGFLQFVLFSVMELVKVGHNPYFNRWFSAIEEESCIITSEASVTILILIDGFLQYNIRWNSYISLKYVTILILIDGFLQ